MPVPVKTPIVASLTAQERFAQNINPNDPEQAMFSYQESMHQHAMEQLEHASASSQNQHPKIESTWAPLLKSDSTSSVSSTTSQVAHYVTSTDLSGSIE
jgi:predicted S18 family serine protease